jgi:hypothetical protein
MYSIQLSLKKTKSKQDSGEGVPGEEPTDEKIDFSTNGEEMPEQKDSLDLNDEAKKTLLSIVDILKQEAQARKAEAESKIQAAKVEQTKYAAEIAASKVKQQEQILDMDQYYKDKKAEEEEAKKLAKLAKFKHHIKQDNVNNEVPSVR